MADALMLLSGAIHNKGLDALTKLEGFPKISRMQTYECVVENVKSTAKSLGFEDFTPLPFQETDELVRRINANPMAMIRQLLEEDNITESQYDVLDDLNLTLSNRRSLEEKIVASTRILLSEKIQLLNARTDISESEKMPLQAALNVAVSSLNYWNNAFEDNLSPWNGLIHSYSGQADLPIIELADCVGFCIGVVITGNILFGFLTGIMASGFALTEAII